MINGLKVLAVIPARGGSKGIQRKNIRFVAGKPLIYYPIRTAFGSKYVDLVYVSSDDDLILRVAQVLGAKVIRRPPELARDDTPLDPVVFHAVNVIESLEDTGYDIIVTLQPTVPLIDATDLDRAIEMLVKEHYDTVVFAVDATHLYWIKDNKDSVWRPLLNIRANRQYLPRIARELGVVITWRKNVRPESRFGQHVGVYIIPESKGVDIDTSTDLLIAETLLQLYRVLFVVDGKRETGLGHIYRCLTIAERLHGHHILFLTNGELGKELISKWGYNVYLVHSHDEIIEYVKNFRPDIVINDILDTSAEYMKMLREATKAVLVNFEDLGEGAYYSDLVFNALYEFSSPPRNHYYGYKYFILRDEFRLFPIKIYYSNIKLRKMTVIFGGVDINNLTMRTLHAIENIGLKSLDLEIIVGPGYVCKDKLREYIAELNREGYRIKLHDSPDFIADIIYSSDLVITSNGRTLYEAVSFAIPTISIAQNERELKHPFAYINKGVKYLGIASSVSIETIAEAINLFTQRPEMLIELNRALLPYAHDIRQGLRRVMRIILDTVIERGSD